MGRDSGNKTPDASEVRMTLQELDAVFQSYFKLQDYAKVDSSKNGLQVARSNQKVSHVAFAVDAVQQTIERAAAIGADVLFTHHGLFWGREQTVTGAHYQRLRALIDADIALYSVHLPLDAHLTLGNNAGMAAALGLAEITPFGLIKGVPIGVSGRFTQPASLPQVIDTLFRPKFEPLAVLDFGLKELATCGIISGGAPYEVDQAIELGLDLFITGDANHNVYHRCLEAEMNAIFAGHYATEVWGVTLVAQQLERDTKLKTSFIDFPTGL